jgi:hypothetical protein
MKTYPTKLFYDSNNLLPQYTVRPLLKAVLYRDVEVDTDGRLSLRTYSER